MCSSSEVREELWDPVKDMSFPVLMGIKGGSVTIMGMENGNPEFNGHI